eukprot:4346574-Pleurochrysis_carterae.AAC.4
MYAIVVGATWRVLAFAMAIIYACPFCCAKQIGRVFASTQALSLARTPCSSHETFALSAAIGRLWVSIAIDADARCLNWCWAMR